MNLDGKSFNLNITPKDMKYKYNLKSKTKPVGLLKFPS